MRETLLFSVLKKQKSNFICVLAIFACVCYTVGVTQINSTVISGYEQAFRISISRYNGNLRDNKSEILVQGRVFD